MLVSLNVTNDAKIDIGTYEVFRIAPSVLFSPLNGVSGWKAAGVFGEITLIGFL